MNFALVNNRFAKIAILLSAVSFLWIGAFGLLRHGLGMKSGGETNGCLFDGQMEVCNMNVSDHITTWQTMLTGLPQNDEVMEALFLAAMFVVTILFTQITLSKFSERITTRYYLYIKQHPQIHLFDSLKEAFSRGILNSKIYAEVTI